MKSTLTDAMKRLRLSGMKSTMELRLQEARANQLTHDEFLELIFQDELNIRDDRLIKRRLKAANFHEHKTLEDFDWDFNRSIQRKLLYQLATGDFIRKTLDLLFVGPPGVGKSHLAQAIGYQAVKLGFIVYYRSIFSLVRDFRQEENLNTDDRILRKYLKPDLLIIDDMGLRKLPERSGECLFEVIMRRHQNRSTIMTSNRPIEEWGKLIDDIPAAGAILDRFLQHATVISIKGKSFRLKDKAIQN